MIASVGLDAVTGGGVSDVAPIAGNAHCWGVRGSEGKAWRFIKRSGSTNVNSRAARNARANARARARRTWYTPVPGTTLRAPNRPARRRVETEGRPPTIQLPAA